MSFCQPIPQDPLACYLFTFNGKVVAVDLVGAGIPLVAVGLFCFILLQRAKWEPDIRHLALGVGFCSLLGVIVAIEFSVWARLFGGIAVQTQFFLFSTVFPAGFLQFVVFVRSKEAVSLLKPYVMATLAMVISDFVRTFSGALTVSPQILGGSGPFDGVFLAGLFMALAYVFAAFVYFQFWTRRASVKRPVI